MQTRRSVLASSAAFAFIRPYSSVAKASTGDPVTRIAFSSCAKQWEPQPIWDAISSRSPDLFLFLGDAIYGDWHGEETFTPTAESLLADWEMLADIPEFSAFRDKTPILATWDNHDYGKHDGGAEFSLKDTTKEIFLDFFREPSGSERRKREGIYDAKTFGPIGQQVQIILLDGRSFKSPYVIDERSADEKAALNIRGQYLPNPDPNATLLGEAQWAWLEAQLKQPADIRIIASGTQVVANEKAMEEWGNFPTERERLFDLIGSTGAQGVLFLSGNVHFSEISETNLGPYLLTDFTASGMTHTTPAYAELENNNRVAGPFTGFNFGELEIDWGVPNGVEINLTCFDAVGTSQFSRRVRLGDLK